MGRMQANTIFSNDSLNKIFYRSRGFGFITFKNAESVDAVQANRPHEIDGRSTETKRAMPREVNISPGLQIRVYWKIIFQPKHMLWVLNRTITMRRFFWVAKTHV